MDIIQSYYALSNKNNGAELWNVLNKINNNERMRQSFNKTELHPILILTLIPSTAQEMKFSSRISSVNVTKSAVNCGFGHIY